MGPGGLLRNQRNRVKGKLSPRESRSRKSHAQGPWLKGSKHHPHCARSPPQPVVRADKLAEGLQGLGIQSQVTSTPSPLQQQAQKGGVHFQTAPWQQH